MSKLEDKIHVPSDFLVMNDSHKFILVEDVKEAIENVLESVKETIRANDGVNIENFDWIIKDFEESFGFANSKTSEVQE